jgi:hypothetical protein
MLPTSTAMVAAKAERAESHTEERPMKKLPLFALLLGLGLFAVGCESEDAGTTTTPTDTTTTPPAGGTTGGDTAGEGT